MRRRHDVGRERAFQENSTLARDPKILTQERLCCARSKANQHFRPHNLQLSIKPRTAGFDFRLARLLVDAALAALSCDPLEMLNNIGDEHLRTVDSNFDQCFVEQFSGRPNKGMANLVFAVAGLFADEHHARRSWAFPKNCLRGISPQITSLAVAGSHVQSG
jgi:hypothetical protein